MKNKQLVFADNLFDLSKSVEIINGNAHYHNVYEIFYLTEGNCNYFIDDNSYHLSAGDIAMIPAGIIHKTNYESIRRSRILLNIPEEYIPNSLKEPIQKILYYPKNTNTAQKIRDIFVTIEDEYKNSDNFSEDAIRFKIAELLLLIARTHNTKEIYTNKNSLIKQAVTFIHNNYASNITLSDVAEQCYVSNEHLSRTFKKETGFSFREFLNIYRLKKAETILKTNPQYRIVDVALCCGFTDSNYFSKVYKQMYNISPTQAKKKGK